MPATWPGVSLQGPRGCGGCFDCSTAPHSVLLHSGGVTGQEFWRHCANNQLVWGRVALFSVLSLLLCLLL